MAELLRGFRSPRIWTAKKEDMLDGYVSNSNDVAAGKQERFSNPGTVPANDKAVAGPLTRRLPFPSDGRSFDEKLPSTAKPVNVCVVKVPSQRDGRSMNRRPGQRGTVYVVGEKYVGRYRVDVSGQTKRKRLPVVIGSIHEMSRPQAERWLAHSLSGKASIPPLTLNVPAHQSSALAKRLQPGKNVT